MPNGKSMKFEHITGFADEATAFNRPFSERGVRWWTKKSRPG